MTAERTSDDILWQPPSEARGPAMELDFVWPDERVAAQIDGHRHKPAPAAERDPQDRLLEAQGYRVLRISQHEMTDNPDALVTRLRRELDRAQRSPTTTAQPS